MNRRQVKELWTKPVPEAKYLNAENVSRYRLIMRLFYENHSKLKYWLKPEEVYEGVMRWGLLADYTLDECNRDLETLKEWGNLNSRHDGGRASTIEEYLRKRFRYQMTPYAIEIERMLNSLENIQGYGGSLEPTLLERIVGYVELIRAKSSAFREGEALMLWRDLQGAFKQLHENASDYLASLQTGKAEELMMTEKFILYKDTFTHYLRNFVLGLQQHGSVLEAVLQETPEAVWEAYVRAVVEDEGRLPTLDEPFSPEERFLRRREEWEIFRQWFTGRKGEVSDMVYLERATKESIARMLKLALAIQEKHRWGVSRKKELDYLGQWFLRLESVEEAHRLGAYVFGMFKARHFQGEGERTSDSADLSLWDEAPIYRELRSRSRIRRAAAETEAVRDTSAKRRQAQETVLAQKALEEMAVRKWLESGSLRMSELGGLTLLERRLLLQWISRCMASRSRTIRTPDGLQIRLIPPPGEARARLMFEDGSLDMPDFQLIIKEVAGG